MKLSSLQRLWGMGKHLRWENIGNKHFEAKLSKAWLHSNVDRRKPWGGCCMRNECHHSVREKHWQVGSPSWGCWDLWKLALLFTLYSGSLLRAAWWRKCHAFFFASFGSLNTVSQSVSWLLIGVVWKMGGGLVDTGLNKLREAPLPVLYVANEAHCEITGGELWQIAFPPIHLSYRTLHSKALLA